MMRVDRRLTLAFLFAIFIQSCGAMMWAGSAAERLDAVEREVEFRRIYLSRITRIETQVKSISAQLDRIERKLDEQ